MINFRVQSIMLTSIRCRCVFPIVSPSSCRLFCQNESASAPDSENPKMSRNQHNCHWRFQSTRLFSHQMGGYEPSFRRLGMTSGFHASQIRPQINQNNQRRHVHAHHCVNLVVQESELDPIRIREEKLRNQMCSLRKWEHTTFGREIQRMKDKQHLNGLKFTVLSYNVLAQNLLEEHSYLYKKSDPEALDWERRSERILREVKDTQADILCLQEVQADHFHSFYIPRLRNMGFKGIFKKRTGGKPDGCAIFFRKSKFELKGSIPVEYCKPNVEILDRDNIGLVVLLTPRVLRSGKSSTSKNSPFIVVATTHLLYNPRRHDIKLAQLQLLFAELDLISLNPFNTSSNSDPRPPNYPPIILTGDFNLTPDSSVYQFITRGSLQYKGLCRKQLIPVSRGHVLDKELIPPHLNVTDQCQHLHALEKRLSATNLSDSEEPTAESSEGEVKFSSGQLSHQLKLKSVYTHKLNRLNGTNEATTYQNGWVTVDYIFHNGCENKSSQLRLLSRLGLLAGPELESLESLPSLASPSDHLPLAASFFWNFDGV